MRAPPVVLSIAGYDPSSGAGVTADIKTAAALGCYAVTCPTALTVQSTQGVFGVKALAPKLVSTTLEALADDFDIAAVRIGMLGSGKVAKAVWQFLRSNHLPNVVLDPVIVSSSGKALIEKDGVVDEAGVEVLKELLPLCDVITPNIWEAGILAKRIMADDEVFFVYNANWLPQMRRLADGLHDLGAKAVIITGGHFDPPNDYLSYPQSGRIHEQVFPGEHIDSRSTHGTGCAFAMALACRLALGDNLIQAARAAKDYVRKAILSAYPLGKGIGPVNHFG